MSDRPVSKTSTRRHTTLNKRHPCLGRVRTRSLTKRAAADPDLKPRGHCELRVAFLGAEILKTTSVISQSFVCPLWYLGASCFLCDISELRVSSVISRSFVCPLWYLGALCVLCGISELRVSSAVSRSFACPLWYLGASCVLCGISELRVSSVISRSFVCPLWYLGASYVLCDIFRQPAWCGAM
jgi:hypothetical protein